MCYGPPEARVIVTASPKPGWKTLKPRFANLRRVPNWPEIERAVVDGFFRFSPSLARKAGDHRFDGVVGDVSAGAIHARVGEIDRQLTVLERPNGLTRNQDIDRRALKAQLQSERFELAELRRPRSDPLLYVGFGSELDVSAYIKRDYAPLPERLDALRRHLEGTAGYLESARSNLEASLPRPHLEIAIDATQGLLDYLTGEVLAVAVSDPATAEAVGAASKELARFHRWLQGRVVDAHDRYALGSDQFSRYLGIREMLDLDVPSLERMVAADIERNTALAREIAGQIAPGDGIGPALDQLHTQHPTVESLIADVRGMLERIRTFILEHDVASVPSDVRCQVKPTPAYMAYITAALDGAGPLETTADESYYYVTVPATDWGPGKTQEWLRYLNYVVLENTSIHEAYPGHYLQGLHERRAGSLSRQVFWVQSTGEGWAHYCEQMMIEAGYSSDPRHELAQLIDALLRDCRFLTSLGLHCRQMPMEEAVRLFMDLGFQSELPARREATRGAWDPLYLNYTLGKLLIYELRREAERRPGYSLKSFHDAFLGAGNLPLPLVREVVLT